MTAIPPLETTHLRLRAHTVADFDACSAMWADPNVVRYIGGKPSTPSQTWQRILTYMGLWKALSYGYWAIEEKRTGKFIGEIGFADFKRDIAASMREVPEIGFALASDAHGKGYATQALRAVLDWGDAHLPSKRTVALVSEGNAVSLHMLQQAGYAIFDKAEFNGSPVLFLERSAPARR